MVLFFCPLAIGTVHPWAIGTAAGLALLAAALTAWATLRSGEPFLVPSPGIAFTAVTAYIGFQLLPLPPFLVGLLAPRTRELHEFVLGPLGHYPAWRPLSLDPPATALELVKAVTYLAVFLCAAQIVRSRRAKSRLIGMLGAVGVVVAVIGFGHALWGATALFGVFSFQHAAPPFLTPFGNPNHLASFLALCATALLAKVLTERDRKIATLWAFGYLATGVGVLLSLSRGGIVAFVAAQLMLGIAVWMVRQSESEGVALRPRAFVVPASVLLVLAVAAYIAWDALAAEFATADSLDKLKDSKLAMWSSFWPLVREHWLVGHGRGAFEVAFQRFQDPAWGQATFTHAENLVGQWVSDLGVPMGLLLLGACAWALLGALRRGATDPERLACIFGLAAISLHELVDFGLEQGGLAVPATLAFAVASFRQENATSFRRRAAALLVPVIAGVTALGMVRALPSLRRDGEELAARLSKDKADDVAAAAVQMAERHPADYFPQLVAAQAYAAERPLHPDKLVGFANRAMYLNPSLPLPHRLAALALRAKGHLAQARIEYKLAYELKDPTVVAEVTRVFQKTEELLEAIPDRPEALAHLADQLITERRYEDAQAVAQASLARHGEKPDALQRLARIAGARGQPQTQLLIGERLTKIAPNQTSGLQVRVEALMAQGDAAGALALLEGEGLQRFPRDAGVLLSLARLRLSRGDTKGCREALKRLPAGMDPGARLAALSLESSAAERDGQGTRALALMRQAVAMRPEDAGWQWQHALLLERLGRFDQAAHEAAAAADKSPSLREEAEKLKARAAAKKQELEQMRRWKDVADGEKSR
ncbi:MAG: O-antigen ligase family protein [Deltaproteobacteria bacterium]|nr:O-antigen ligase family protein [Deltaproteobacteria bacterium]